MAAKAAEIQGSCCKLAKPTLHDTQTLKSKAQEAFSKHSPGTDVTLAKVFPAPIAVQLQKHQTLSAEVLSALQWLLN